MKRRCPWAGDEPAMISYHDKEWGRPTHDDRTLFEFLILEGAQAGLSWRTILLKRDGYRRGFHGFDPAKVSHMTERDVRRLMKDSGIVRNRLKIRSAIGNAKRFREVQKEFGSFDRYLRQFVVRAQRRRPTHMADIPTTTPASDALSADLRRRGFRFVGPTICYAFMQAVGIVDDHLQSCYRAKNHP